MFITNLSNVLFFALYYLRSTVINMHVYTFTSKYACIHIYECIHAYNYLLSLLCDSNFEFALRFKYACIHIYEHIHGFVSCITVYTYKGFDNGVQAIFFKVPGQTS